MVVVVGMLEGISNHARKNLRLFAHDFSLLRSERRSLHLTGEHGAGPALKIMSLQQAISVDPFLIDLESRIFPIGTISLRSPV